MTCYRAYLEGTAIVAISLLQKGLTELLNFKTKLGVSSSAKTLESFTL